jgi:hypothetical protein
MRFRNVFLGAVVVTLLGGCANQADPGQFTPGTPMPKAAPLWTEPAAYKFTLTSSCGERALTGRFRTTVKDGLVIQNEGLDAAARRALKLQLSRLVPTLGELMAKADTARKAGADEVVIQVDQVDGHPTSISIDPDKSATDDEECYAISDYSVG